MVVVLVVIAVVVVGVVVARIAWRPEDEVGSVQSYHRALDTIEHLAMGNAAPVRTIPGGSPGVSRDPSPYSDRSGSRDSTGREAPDVSDGPVRRGPPDVSDGPVRREGGVAEPDLPDRRSAAPDERVDGLRPGTKELPLVFDDTAPVDDLRVDGDDVVVPRFRSNRARRVAMASMDHRSRRWSVAVATVVVVAVAAVAVDASRHHTSATAARRSAPVGRSTAPRRPASTAGVTPARSAKTGSGHKKRTHPSAPAAPTQLVATTSSPTAAVYPVSTGAYKVTLAATGPCWIDATATSTGSTVWTGTMEAGQTQVLPATGPMTVEIGSTAAALSMNGEAVVLPTPLQAPFVATFEPGPGAAS